MEHLLEYLKIILIGIVEGITEWLPVSSTGHMILVNDLVHLHVSEDFWNMFLVVIQLGAILAVCILYFKTLNPFALSKSTEEKKDTWSLWAKVIVGVLPAAAIGLPLNDWMEEHLTNSWVVAAALIVYGIAFILIENFRSKPGLDHSESHARGKHFAQTGEASLEETSLANMRSLSYKRAFCIGCFQVLSLVPGTSRSGSTILGALLMGTSRQLAAEFSFFMAIPVMFGASLLKLLKFFLKGNSFDMYSYVLLFLGMLVALIVSILAIKFLMRYIKRHDFKVFGYYRIILGLVVIVYGLLKGFGA